MARLPGSVHALLALGLLSNLVVADVVPAGAGRADSCATPGAKECLVNGAISTEEVGSLVMLQQGAKAVEARLDLEAKRAGAKKRQTPVNSTELWEQLKGAVEIDNINEAIQNATDSDTVNKLQSKLADLQEEFPSAQEIQQTFSDQWASITQAVNMENIQQQLDAAKAAGSSEVDVLQQKYDALKANMQNSLDSVQDQAARTWASMQASLPNLDNLTAQAQEVKAQAKDLANQAGDATSSAVNSATGAVSNAASSATGAVSDAASSAADAVSNAASSAKDAVSDATSNVQDAVSNALSGLFR